MVYLKDDNYQLFQSKLLQLIYLPLKPRSDSTNNGQGNLLLI